MTRVLKGRRLGGRGGLKALREVIRRLRTEISKEAQPSKSQGPRRIQSDIRLDF